MYFMTGYSQQVANMRLQNTQHDEAALAELGQRLARIRIDLALTQADLAKEAGIGKRTLERLEAGESTQVSTLLRVLRVLRLVDRLDAVIPEATLRPTESLKRKGRAPKRVRKPRSPQRKWQWGDEQ